MKEKCYLEMKKGKIYCYFVGKKYTMKKDNIQEVKNDLESQGRIVELKQ